MVDTRKARVKRYEDYVADSVAVLKKLDDATIAYLIRASEESSAIDGYGRGAGEERVAGSNYAEDGTVPGSTPSAVLARQCGRCKGKGSIAGDTDDQRCPNCAGSGEKFIADPVGDAIEDIFTRLAELSGHAKLIGRKLPIVMEAATRMRGRGVSSITQCQCCTRDVACTTADPIRAGYCKSCAPRWYEWKSENGSDDNGADRLRFEAERREFLAEKAAS